MKDIALLILLGTFSLALTGCNTMQGAGKDIERGGEKVSDAAHKVRAEWREAWGRNESDYDAARARCAGMSDPDREACRERERAEYRRRMNEARATYRRSDMRSESDQDRREDAYEAARDRCDSLRGAAEDRCIADARAQYRR